MVRSWERRPVDADLGDQHLGDGASHTGDGLQSAQVVSERGELDVDLDVERVEVIDVSREIGQHHRVTFTVEQRVDHRPTRLSTTTATRPGPV